MNSDCPDDYMTRLEDDAKELKADLERTKKALDVAVEAFERIKYLPELGNAKALHWDAFEIAMEASAKIQSLTSGGEGESGG